MLPAGIEMTRRRRRHGIVTDPRTARPRFSPSDRVTAVEADRDAERVAVTLTSVPPESSIRVAGLTASVTLGCCPAASLAGAPHTNSTATTSRTDAPVRQGAMASRREGQAGGTPRAQRRSASPTGSAAIGARVRLQQGDEPPPRRAPRHGAHVSLRPDPSIPGGRETLGPERATGPAAPVGPYRRPPGADATECPGVDTRIAVRRGRRSHQAGPRPLTGTSHDARAGTSAPFAGAAAARTARPAHRIAGEGRRHDAVGRRFQRDRTEADTGRTGPTGTANPSTAPTGQAPHSSPHAPCTRPSGPKEHPAALPMTCAAVITN